MSIAKGMALGPYEILMPIGAGGMGEVWRARDHRIRRDVAVKVLPQTYDVSHDQVWRFEQEARAAGALNHPGLVTIFDVGNVDGSPYIVMELLEGKTLRDVIGDVAATALPLKKALQYATQIAAALAVAHDKGIIHRDLKPENIFITSDGRAKILDFGLAKLAENAIAESGPRQTARHATSAGIAVGTPGYMSPEQVRAQPIDCRTDIFSFGAVLYEMLSGRPAFDAPTAVETMHAVLNTEPPDLTTLDPKIPPALNAIVTHCLEKNPCDRGRSAHDLAFQLQVLANVQTTTAAGKSALRAPRRMRYRVAAAVMVMLAAAGAFAIYHARNGESGRSPRSFKQLTFDDGLEFFPSLAPDGTTFAFVSTESGNRDIYMQRVDGRSAINITSDSPDDDSEPAFSPDGSRIAFRSERGGGGIFVMGVTGESVRRITDLGHNPSWSPDGTRIVVATERVELSPHLRPRASDLWIVDTQTGARRPLLQVKTNRIGIGRESDAVQPSWSPNGKRIAFWGVNSALQRNLWTIDPDASQPKQTLVQVTSDSAFNWNPVWSPDGRYLYFGSNRDGTVNLWRIAMDEDTGRPAGTPEAITLPAFHTGNFSFSHHGEMVYVAANRLHRLFALPFDPNLATFGQPRPLFGGPQEIWFEPSPDGKSIVFATAGGAQEDVFIANVDGKHARQLTNDAAADRRPTWSPDGKTIYFQSNRSGTYHIWSIRADGSGLARMTDDADLRRIDVRHLYAPDVSPDGKTLAAATDTGTVLVHLDRPVHERLERLPVSMSSPTWSPDGLHLLGTDASSATRTVLVVYSLQGRRAERIADEGRWPSWLSNEKIMFFAREHATLLDLKTRRPTIVPAPSIPGVDLSASGFPRFSRDASTIYVRQILEEGDVWIVRFGNG